MKNSHFVQIFALGFSSLPLRSCCVLLCAAFYCMFFLFPTFAPHRYTADFTRIMSLNSAKLLSLVREAMKCHSIQALIVPSSDPHNSEYVMDSYKCRAFLTNFNGSAGTCLITMDGAYLWTDGRYWIEAARCLYPEWKLMREGSADVQSLDDFVRFNLPTDAAVGMNDSLATVASWEKLSKAMNLVPVPEIVRPLMPRDENAPVEMITVRPEKFNGQSRGAKVMALVEKLKKLNCEAIILSALDEVAWLTNLRGSDVPFNPVFYAYAVVRCSPEPSVALFVDAAKISPAVEMELKRSSDGVGPVGLHPYEALEDYLHAFPTGTPFLVDEHQTSWRLYSLLISRGMKVHRVKSGPAQRLKSIKNAVEIQGFRDCHVRDGLALTRYLAWLHDRIALKGDTTITESSGADVLENFRREQEHFVRLSFPTISSVGPNGAIVHYTPPKEGSAPIVKNQLYLVDSGAQYLDGTTDVTRTVCFHTPSDEERQAYTLVLKGNLALHSAVWPVGTTGHRLDALARMHLWRYGLDYAHGTGHGVGSFLNVHEGPQGIGSRPNPTEATLEAGMVMSNEPGYYKADRYGIRIENLEVIVETPREHSDKGFLTFETLTMVPLCRELINVAMLTEEEVNLVNVYHRAVREALTPHLRLVNDACALAYLEHHTADLCAAGGC
uniref:Putative aminopeptidase P1 n=1 Tax=Trypanosoma congolense (strain IL3000) TaxID=1068625 RepID=G0UJZ0_TRYCI|nr:putative aminopeptidase P1 [Trypanosoma congolense IL3000]